MRLFKKLLKILNCIVNLSVNDKKTLSFLCTFDKLLYWIDRIFLVSVIVFNFYYFTKSGDVSLAINLILAGVVVSLAVRLYLSCKILKNKSILEKNISPSNFRKKPSE
jgi:putative effector of murein hydrolase